MENLAFSLNATMPVFLLMVLGMFLRRMRIIDDAFAARLNAFVFHVALPSSFRRYGRDRFRRRVERVVRRVVLRLDGCMHRRLRLAFVFRLPSSRPRRVHSGVVSQQRRLARRRAHAEHVRLVLDGRAHDRRSRAALQCGCRYRPRIHGVGFGRGSDHARTSMWVAARHRHQSHHHRHRRRLSLGCVAHADAANRSGPESTA